MTTGTAAAIITSLGYVGPQPQICVPLAPGFFGVEANTPVQVYQASDVKIDRAKLVGASYDGQFNLQDTWTGIEIKISVVIGQYAQANANGMQENHSARGNIVIPKEQCPAELIEYAFLHEGIQGGKKMPGQGLKQNAEGRYESGSGWYSMEFTGEACFAFGETTERPIPQRDGSVVMRKSTPIMNSAFATIAFKQNVILGTQTAFTSGWMAGASANVAAQRPAPVAAPQTPVAHPVTAQVATPGVDLSGLG